MKVFLIVLEEGGGYEWIKVVDQETFEWVTSKDPGKANGLEEESWEDQLVPGSQVAKMKAEYEEYRVRHGMDDAFQPLRITSASWDNDRAVAACPADGYDTYCTAKEALQAVKEKGDSLQDQICGLIY